MLSFRTGLDITSREQLGCWARKYKENVRRQQHKMKCKEFIITHMICLKLRFSALKPSNFLLVKNQDCIDLIEEHIKVYVSEGSGGGQTERKRKQLLIKGPRKHVPTFKPIAHDSVVYAGPSSLVI